MTRGLLLAMLLAGCAAAPEPADPLVFDLPVEHDHASLAEHAFAHGLVRVGGAAIEDILAGEPGRLSDLQFHGELAAVAVHGGAGGFVLLNATTLEPIARYASGSDDNWYVRFTPDGRYALLTANARLPPAPGAARDALTQPTLAHAARGLQVVDVTDPRMPRLVGVYASPIRLINVAAWVHDDATYVAASVVADRAIGPAPAPGVAANEVHILRLDDGVPALVARWAPPDPCAAPACPQLRSRTPPQGAGAEVFVHDVAIERHPFTGATLLYAGAWDAGAFLVDVSDPAAPRDVGRYRSDEERPQLHTVKPHPGIVDGRHLTLAAPETFAGDASGRYHLLDTTDPARPALVATWELPDERMNPENLMWSPHEFTLADGHAYTSNFHAGVVVLSLPQLTPVAAWAAPAAAPREESARWAVDVETVTLHEGRIYALDMGRGIDILADSPAGESDP